MIKKAREEWKKTKKKKQSGKDEVGFVIKKLGNLEFTSTCTFLSWMDVEYPGAALIPSS